MEGLFRGIWYHSGVKLEADTLVPIPPFQAYNPFDWYYSTRDLRQGEKSLYLEFLAVDSSDYEAVRNFCERFGVLGTESFFLEEIAKAEESQIRNRKVIYFPPPGTSKKSIEYLQARSIDLASSPPEALCRPLTIKEFYNTQYWIRRMISENVFENDPVRNKKKIELITTLLNDALFSSRIQPRLSWNHQEMQWEISWVSVDLTGYLCLMFMLDLLGPGKILSCPRCKSFFMTASNRTRFCSFSCYNVYKVQEHIKRKKERELAAKKSKKGKTAKRPAKRK